MTLSGNQFNYRSMRLIAAAALISTLAFAPGVVLGAEKDAHQDRTELRIKELHTKLKITSAEESQWTKVAETMRDDAKNMDTLIQDRLDHAKGMTAVDDLKAYSKIADARAEGVKKLIPEFTALYDTMSDAQKKEADTLFRNGEHKHGHKPSKAK